MAIGPFEDQLVKHGAIFGTIAFVAGMVLTVPLLFVAGGDLAIQARELPLAMAAFGYMLLHAWPVFLGQPPGFLLFAVIPAVLLALVGYATARRTAALSTSARYRGASVVFGYLPATALAFGYVVLRADVGGDVGLIGALAALDPRFLLTSIGYTGLLFPIVFGAIGGLLAGRRAD